MQCIQVYLLFCVIIVSTEAMPCLWRRQLLCDDVKWRVHIIVSPCVRVCVCDAVRRKEETIGRDGLPIKKQRLVFTDIQRRTLMAIFKETQRPSKEMQLTIAEQLGLKVCDCVLWLAVMLPDSTTALSDEDFTLRCPCWVSNIALITKRYSGIYSSWTDKKFSLRQIPFDSASRTDYCNNSKNEY